MCYNRVMKKSSRFIVAIAFSSFLALLFSGCASKVSYKHISQEEAARIMAEETGFVIADVREPSEYAEGHIVGAINVPLSTIGSTPLAALPDLNQRILVYCRSGVRSKKASEKLSKIGYSNILEFGGIMSWKGEIVQ